MGLKRKATSKLVKLDSFNPSQNQKELKSNMYKRQMFGKQNIASYDEYVLFKS